MQSPSPCPDAIRWGLCIHPLSLPARRDLRDLYIAGATMPVHQHEPHGLVPCWPAQLSARLRRARVHECNSRLVGPDTGDLALCRMLAHLTPRAPLLPQVAALTSLTLSSWHSGSQVITAPWRQVLAPCALHLQELALALGPAARGRHAGDEELPYPAVRALRLQLPFEGEASDIGTLSDLPALTLLDLKADEWPLVNALLCTATTTVAALRHLSLWAPDGPDYTDESEASRAVEVSSTSSDSDSQHQHRPCSFDMRLALREATALRALTLGVRSMSFGDDKLVASIVRLPSMHHLTSLRVTGTKWLYGEMNLEPFLELAERLPLLCELQLADRTVHPIFGLELSSENCEGLCALDRLQRVGLHGFRCMPQQARVLVAKGGPVWQKVLQGSGFPGGHFNCTTLPGSASSAAV